MNCHCSRLLRKFTQQPAQNLNVLPSWHLLQSAKFPTPKARVLLWQLAQLRVPAGAACMAARGEATCRPRNAPGRRLWQLAQFMPLLKCS